MCLATVSAAAAPDPPPVITPPAPGVTPGVAVTSGTWVDMFYTATDRTVWILEGVGTSPLPVPYGGRLVSAPAAIWTGSAEIVFGRGTDNQLWYSQVGDVYGVWRALGGKLTAGPGAVSLGGGSYAVFVRGTDGAVWQRVYNGAACGPWQSLGGRVLPGTGPTAAYLTGNGHLYVGIVGTNGKIYLKVANRPGGFFSIGGRTTASPALTAISPSTLVAFSRGTNGAGYYNRYTETGGAGRWRSIGGRLTSGLAAGAGVVTGKPTTYTFGLGPDNQVYENAGTWASYPPTFSGWVQITSPSSGATSSPRTSS
jgi:hypothetical protein